MGWLIYEDNEAMRKMKNPPDLEGICTDNLKFLAVYLFYMHHIALAVIFWKCSWTSYMAQCQAENVCKLHMER